MLPMIERLQRFSQLDRADLDALKRLPHRIRETSAHEEIIATGQKLDRVFIVESGWLIRSRLLDDGRRQILNFMLPGDCFDLQCLVRARADHTVTSATLARLRMISASEFLDCVRDNANLATAFWWAAVQEESILREQIVRLGRRTARERIAHMMLELIRRRRLATAGTANDELLKLPVTREMIADALGLSEVHVSRTTSFLRQAGLLDVSNGTAKVLDLKGLMRLADFDETYLHVDEKFRLPGREHAESA